MCISSHFNINFPWKIFNTNIKDTDSTAQCDICKFWIQTKCKNLNHTDYCISCCNEIFPFGKLAIKIFLFMMMVNSSPSTVKNSDADHISSTSSIETFRKSIYFIQTV